MAEYIEREAVLECIYTDGYDGEFDLGYYDHNVAFQELIKEIPAADVRPVVRGEWDDKPVAFFLKCSKCGCCVAHRYNVFLDEGELNYCPNCGADMRGE